MIHEIEAARDGDLTAFARLVETHHACVCAITTAILGDPVAGEDAAQEAFLTSWRKLHQLDDPARFSGWLRQIARNTARMHQRSARRRPDAVVATAVDVAEPAVSAEEALQAAETANVLALAVSELPEDVREVLVLYYREGRSTAEVASQLSLSEPAVRKRLSRARETLKADVESRFGGWMEQTRPRAGFVAAVLVAVGLAGVPRRADAAPRRGPWIGAASLVLGASVALILAFRVAPETPGPASREEPRSAAHPVTVAARALPLSTSDEVEPEVAEPPTGPAESPIREALAALAEAGGQRIVRCDVTGLGVPTAEIAAALGVAFPPAVDVSDGVVTLLTDPSDGGYFGAPFRDQSLSLDLDPGGPGSVTGCTIELAPPFAPIELPTRVTLNDMVDSLAVGLEKSADHDLEVTPTQLALEDPGLSRAARHLLETWVARQAEEAERAMVRAEMWSANPDLTITIH